ncbi:MAG TPA: GNAT family N-acetyltransferase [Acidimicrobiales bacterium]|nr:GNAT family N-acetyltransferase [Acidimicrobiales bacterium]
MEDAVIVGLDPVTLESADIAALAALAESLRLEAGVDDTPITFESEEQAWRCPLPSGARRVLAVARTDAGAVGRGDATFMYRNGERLAEIGILYVLPEFRRSGIGSRLLAEVLEGCHPDTLLVGTTTDRVPAGDFAASVGATVGLRHDRYKLEVAQIDWDRYWRWADEGGGPDYELLRWHGACPEGLLESYVGLTNVMNSAPQGDMEQPPLLALSVEEFRERQARREALRVETWTVVARQRLTGMLVGLHDVTVPSGGTVATVQNTGVVEAHRGHGIGRWLKAVMALWLADERPAVVRFVTATSDINHHMRRVNEELGYQLELERSIWQVRVGPARSRLRSRLTA